MTARPLRRLAESGVIAALYAALSLCLAPLSFGPIQLRAAEALTLLPVLTPAAVPGLAVGCAIANAVGVALGANVAGALDILLGTLATAVAALLTRWLRRYRVKGFALLAAVPPVLCNALLVGLELSLTCFPAFTFGTYALCAGQIALSELIAAAGGVFMVAALERTGAHRFLQK